jgi:hypothetical protein
VDRINREVKAKFPKKSFDDITASLKEKDIISYAYLFKEFSYKTEFATNAYMNFND